MSELSYQTKFDEGDEIILNGAYITILDKEDGEYYIPQRGRLKWVDAAEIDAVAEKRSYSE